jgi:hypothetical protein
MTGRTLLFVHALLGTLCIFAAQKAEELARDQPEHKILSQWLPYIGIFLVLLILDWRTEKLHQWLHNRREKRLKIAGKIEGYWLESSSNEEGTYGSFIKITFLEKTQFFEVEGPIFRSTGESYGNFKGHGRADPLGQKLLYDYTGTHGKWRDYGTGDFVFSDVEKERANAFSGSFYGAATKIVRNVKGVRTRLPNIVNNDSTAMENAKRDAVIAYLATETKSTGAK